MPLKTYFYSTGWRRRFIAMVLGICATLALPPLYLLPFLIPAFSGLFLLICHAPTRRQAFLDGWWWGLGHFTSGLYWMCISLYVDPKQFAWLTPIVLLGPPAVLGIYIGLVTLAFYSITPSPFYEGESGVGVRLASARREETPTLILPLIGGGGKVIIFAAFWVGVEYLRAHLFTGFPWNLTGYAWTVATPMLQLASVTGIYGLSWLAVFCATMPALFLLAPREAKRANLFAAALLVAAALFGLWRLEANPTRYTDIKVRIVQGNIAQSLKWDPNAVRKGLETQVRLTRSPGLDSIRLVLWPETAVPYYIRSDTPLTEDLGSILPPDALLLTGGLRGNDYDRSHAWNSVFAIDSKGTVLTEYDKHHLVPFGEYIPLRNWPVTGALAKMIAPGMGDFSRGPGPRTMLLPGNFPALSPLVCYEAIFPGEATDGTHRARWLFSLTDDAWFGVSSGPFQDAEMARVRAVEQGLPLLRAANTGVSAAYDAYGRQIASLALEKEGILDLYLPRRAEDESLFSKYPHCGFLFMLLVSVIFLMLC